MRCKTEAGFGCIASRNDFWVLAACGKNADGTYSNYVDDEAAKLVIEGDTATMNEGTSTHSKMNPSKGTMKDSEGTYKYKVDGDKLTFTSEGFSFKFYKVDAKQGKTARKASEDNKVIAGLDDQICRYLDSSQSRKTDISIAE